MSANCISILSLWCAAWSKSSDRQSWTSLAIISPSSYMMVYSGGGRCAFIFFHALPICVAGLLFVPAFCGLGLAAVSCVPSVCFGCSLSGCVLSFFPFWVPNFAGPSSICVVFPWPVLHLLGTWISWGCVSPSPASSSAIMSGTSWVRDGVFHSSSHSLMTMSMSPSMMQ
jgi:hypothetical protein